MSANTRVSVTVCVGSSCHIKGAREVITRFNDLIRRYELAERVELKGSFCMERCGEGLNWLIDDRPMTSPDVDDAVSTFIREIIHPITRQGEK